MARRRAAFSRIAATLRPRRASGDPFATTPARRAACLAEPLEERVLFALAAATGGSGYSADLSSNATIRQQQLICDPIEPKAGSTSVQYDPKVVRLTGY